MRRLIALSLIFAAAPLRMSESPGTRNARFGINNIDTIVVIYAENRSFDNLYGYFPGADGLQNVTSATPPRWTATAPCSRNCPRLGTA